MPPAGVAHHLTNCAIRCCGSIDFVCTPPHCFPAGTDFKFEHLDVEVEFVDFICKPKADGEIAKVDVVNKWIKKIISV